MKKILLVLSILGIWTIAARATCYVTTSDYPGVPAGEVMCPTNYDNNYYGQTHKSFWFGADVVQNSNEFQVQNNAE